jgi:small-conductance mechanosensitive channel
MGLLLKVLPSCILRSSGVAGMIACLWFSVSTIAQCGIEEGSERERWPNIVKMLDNSMNNLPALIVAAQELSGTRIKEFQETCDKVERRCSELNFLLWEQRENAILGISTSMYSKQISDLERYFYGEIEVFQRLSKMYQNESERNAHLKRLLEQVNDKYLDKESLARKNQAHKHLCQFIASMNECTQKMNAAFDASKHLQEELTRVMKEANTRNEEIFKNIFLKPHANIINVLPTLHYGLYLWMVDVPSHLKYQLPNQLSFWVKFILLAILGGIFHVFMGHRIFRRLEKLGMVYWWQQKIWVFSVGWTCLGLALLFGASYFWLSAVEFGMFLRLAMVFFGIAVVMLTLGIRLKSEYYGAVFRLYLPLLLLYILGNILWTMVVTFRPLIFIWTIANIPVVIATIYVLLRHKMQILDRVLGILTIFIALFSVIAASLGYAYLAFSITMIWFLAAIGIQLGASITILVARFKPDTTHRQIVASFIMTIALPLIWIALIGGLAYWTSTMFNMQDMLEKCLVTNLCPDFSSLKITIRDIVFSLIAGLLIYFFISTAKNIIRIAYSEQANMGIMASFLTLGTYCIWFIYIVFVLLLFDVDYSSILVIIGGMSMGIGFGLRDIIENFVCGVILLVGKEVRNGDIIEFDGTWGTVQKISIRATVVKTFDDAVINLPNSVVVSKNFKNWTLSGRIIRKDIKIGVEYGSDIDLVKKTLFDIAASHEDILKTPAPKVLFNDFGASELVFILRVWFRDISRAGQCQSDIREEIDRLFRENNIVIAFPQLDIHIANINSVQEIKKI